MLIPVSEKTFAQEVLQSSTPVLVNFWAPWCGLCRLINPLLLNLQAQWGTQVKVVNINADENLKLASTYRLTTLPTLLMIEKGTVLHRIDSFHGRDDLRLALEKLVGTHTYSL